MLLVSMQQGAGELGHSIIIIIIVWLVVEQEEEEEDQWDWLQQQPRNIKEIRETWFGGLESSRASGVGYSQLDICPN